MTKHKRRRLHLQDGFVVHMKAGKRRCRKVYTWTIMQESFEVWCDIDISRFSKFWRRMLAHIKMQRRHEIAGMN